MQWALRVYLLLKLLIRAPYTMTTSRSYQLVHPTSAIRSSSVMMNFARLAVVLWALSTAQSAFSLNCTPDHISLDSQAEIDSFQANHGNGGVCDTVIGRLRIDGEDVSNLDGLSDILQLGERLNFGYTPNLTNIDGLGALHTVVGELDLSGVPAPNLNGLSSLVSVGEELRLSGLMVSNLVGLSSLESVGGNLVISGNKNLLSLDGLSALSFVGGSILIDYNLALINAGNFPLLESVGGYLVLGNNSSLTSLSGFSQLTEIGAGLSIHENDMLQDIDPLNSVESIGAYIDISYNDVLQNLDGLSSLQQLGNGIQLRDNPMLSDISGLALLSGEVDGFEITYSRVENLDALIGITSLGELVLLNNSELQNLDGLSNLVSVGQDVEIIGNTAMTNIVGLGSLETVGWDLVLWANNQLSSFAGLESLTSVMNSLSIMHNENLLDLSALDGVEHIGDELEIEFNDSLVEIDSFQNLQTVASISIFANNALQLVTGFDQLTSISGELALDAEISGASFAGFSRVTEIGGGFQLTGSGPSNLDDFLSLQSVGGRLDISSHGIEDLNGLSSLVSVGGEAFFNLSNPNLDCLGIIPLLDDIDDGLPGPGPGPDNVPDVGGQVSLWNIHDECDTIQKIRELVTTASLTVNKDFFDDNPGSVLVELACDAPSVLIDVLNDSASEATPAQFALSRFIPGFYSDCAAVEVDVPDGYVADQSGCEAISLVDGGALGCTIFNYDEDWIQSSGFESR